MCMWIYILLITFYYSLKKGFDTTLFFKWSKRNLEEEFIKL